MSIFFERRISRRSEHSSYPALDPARGYFFLTQMMPLELEDIKRYTLLEVLPAYTYRDGAERVDGVLVGDKGVHDAHLTGKYGITSQLILDGTLNPDFSQIEADAGQVDVNLRYDLFFPEKRPFFLEGSEMFQLAGTSDVRSPARPPSTPGRSSTRSSVSSSPARSASGTRWLPSSPWTSRLGAIRLGRTGTTGRPASPSSATRGRSGATAISARSTTGREYGGGANQVAGLDGQIRLTKSSQIGFHGFGSWTKPVPADGLEGGTVRGTAFGTSYLYDTRNLGLSLSFYDISKDFRTDAAT